MGQSRRQAIQAASQFATLGKSAGLTGNDLAKFAQNFTVLASDLASFNNTTPEDAITAIGAALRGEAEPIRRYGVLLNDATLKQKALELGLIRTTKNALNPQQKALAASAVIMEQTKDAQGDFARTSGGLANSQRQLTASMEDLQASIGQALLPVVEAILPLLKTMSSWASDNSAIFISIGAAIAVLATSIIAANIAMSAWKVIAAATAAINTYLGTTFTAVQVSLGAVGVALAAAAAAYVYFSGKKDKATESTRKFADALYLEGNAQKEAIRQLALSNPNIQKNIDLMAALGYTHEDLTEYLTTGQGRLQDYLVLLYASAGLIDDSSRATDVLGQEFIDLAKALNLGRDELNAMYFSLQAVAKEGYQFRAGLNSLTNFGINPTATATGELSKAAKEAERKLKEFKKEAADTFAKVRDGAKTGLKDAREEFARFSSSVVSSLTGGLVFKTAEEAGKETGAGYLAGLKAEADKIKTFSELTNRLLSMGLSEDALQTLLGAGTEAGIKIAQSLIEGGQDAVTGANGINALIETTKKAATLVGQNAANNFRQEGVTLAEALVAGIGETISKFRIKLKTKNLNVKRGERLLQKFADEISLQFTTAKVDVPELANGGIVPYRPGGTLAIVGEAGPEAVVPLDRMGAMGTTVNITVNGGDPNAVVDALRRYMVTNGPVPITVA